MKLRMTLLLTALLALFTTASFALDDAEPKADDAPKTEAAADDKPAADEEKPADDKKPADEEKPADDKKPADEEKPADDKKPADEEKPKDDKKPEDKEEPADEETFKTETVVDGLTNPSGVAIQPETGIVFVADSGAGRVIRIVEGKVEEVITDFPADVYGKGPKYQIGPLGLAFLDKNTLVIGGGGLPDGEELLRVYEIPEAGAEAIKADKMKSSFSLAGKGEELKGEGNFYALAVTKDAVFATSNGDDTKGWVARATRKGNDLSDYERWLPTKEKVDLDAPVGITLSTGGQQEYLVVGQMGEITVPKDSLITFYNVSDGKERLNLKTGLFDITALAYSTKERGAKKQLYALDFAWMETGEGGLFRIIKDKESKEKNAIKARKILSLDKPTAMAFGADGTLYLTVIGPADGEASAKGSLLKVAPGL